jgi:hypothetical protein
MHRTILSIIKYVDDIDGCPLIINAGNPSKYAWCKLIDKTESSKINSCQRDDQISISGTISGYKDYVYLSNCVFISTTKAADPNLPYTQAYAKGHALGLKMLEVITEAKKLINETVAAAQQNDTARAREIQSRISALKQVQARLEAEGIDDVKTMSPDLKDAYTRGGKDAQAGR